MDPRYLFCACLTLISTVSCSVIREEAAYPSNKTEIASPEVEACGSTGEVPTPGVATDQVFYVSSDLSPQKLNDPPSTRVRSQQKQEPASEASVKHAVHTQAVTTKQAVEPDEETHLPTSTLVGFILTLLGSGIFTPIGWAGLACTIVGAIKIKRSPELYHGQGFTIASIAYFAFTIVLLVGIFILWDAWLAFKPVP